MSGPHTANTAGPGSFVGLQAGQVHNSDVYVVGPDDPPETEFEVGCRYLDDGVPGKAREHIEHAQARGLDGSEPRFHHILAILSKRSYRDLAKEDRAVLEELAARRNPAVGDTWEDAQDVVFALLSCVDGSGGDSESAMSRLGTLSEPQHGLILRHLGLVLTGSMKQGVWHQIRRKAEHAHRARGRVDRVWAYFEPEPAHARARRPAPKSTTGWDVFNGLLLACASLLVLGAVVRNALWQGDMLSLLSCLAMFVLGPAAGWHICVWHHTRRRRLAKEREYGYQRTFARPPKRGFTDHVERAFDHYFAKYAPESERDTWLDRTTGVRRSLRDEVARLYRESSVRQGEVNWLIRFLARDVRRRWAGGLPLEPHEIHSVDSATKVRCVVLCLSLTAATVTTFGGAFQQAPVTTVGGVLFLLLASRFALPLWLRLHSERRRHIEESREREDALAAREAEHARWKGKLEELMPSEMEMEAWLDADKALILDQTLKHYRLSWHEVAAHAFLPTPDRPCRSAKVEEGPWRHAKYEIRVFLVTDEGVREATAELDFQRARWHRSERDNYRFDALSSVQVEMESTRRYTLNITLTNGPTKSIPISDPPVPAHVEEEPDPDPRAEPQDINLDAAGFSHTLRILEGIAAEGKPWFDREADPRSDVPPSRPAPDAPPSSGTASGAPARNGVAVRERPTQPLPG